MAKTTDKRPGLLGKGWRLAKRTGKFYVWTVTGDLQELKASLQRLKANSARVLHPEFRNESFSEAVARQGLHEAELDKRADYLASLSFLFGLIAAMAGIFLVATPLSPSPVNHALMSIGVFVVAAAKCAALRFRVAQIRRRQFFEFKDWLLRRLGA